VLGKYSDPTSSAEMLQKSASKVCAARLDTRVQPHHPPSGKHTYILIRINKHNVLAIINSACVDHKKNDEYSPKLTK